MKLRNKLIPFAGCLALGATIAPISLTSCSMFHEVVELKDGYDPTIAKYTNETMKMTIPQAEDVYFKAVKENPDIIAQEYNWTMAKLLKVAADNPGKLFGDSKTSTLETAKQTISNISFGSTKVLYTNASGPASKTLTTISFDINREQTYSYSYNEVVASSKKENEIVGTTYSTISFKNVPVNFYAGFETNNNAVSTDAEFNYDPHLGRGLYNYPNIVKYIPTEWFLMTAIIPDAVTTSPYGKYALANMRDAWEISFQFSTYDQMSSTFEGVKTEKNETSTINGKYNDFNSIDPTDASAKELLGFRIGSYYLSGIHALN